VIPRTLALLFATPLLAVAPAFASSLAHPEVGHFERSSLFSTAFLWTGGDGFRDEGCDSPGTRVLPRATALATLGCSSVGVGFEGESPAVTRRSPERIIASGPRFTLVDRVTAERGEAPDVLWSPDVGVNPPGEGPPAGHDTVQPIPEPSAAVAFGLGTVLVLTQLRGRLRRS
jgi:hypothetical protein